MKSEAEGNQYLGEVRALVVGKRKQVLGRQKIQTAERIFWYKYLHITSHILQTTQIQKHRGLLLTDDMKI